MGISSLDISAWLSSRQSPFPSEHLYCSYSFQTSSPGTNLELSLSCPQHQHRHALLADARISPLLLLLPCSFPSSFCSFYLSLIPSIKLLPAFLASGSNPHTKMQQEWLWPFYLVGYYHVNSLLEKPHHFPFLGDEIETHSHDLWEACLGGLGHNFCCLCLCSLPSLPPARAPHCPLSGPYVCMLPHHWLDFSLASSPSAKNFSILQGLVPILVSHEFYAASSLGLLIYLCLIIHSFVHGSIHSLIQWTVIKSTLYKAGDHAVRCSC